MDEKAVKKITDYLREMFWAARSYPPNQAINIEGHFLAKAGLLFKGLEELGYRILPNRPELRGRIQEILDTAITVDNNCKVIPKADQILALLELPKDKPPKEIREGINTSLTRLLGHYLFPEEMDEFLKDLDKLGVVIKVEKAKPSGDLEAVEPLIKE